VKIYLASQYSRREEMLCVRTALQLMGHVVTARWLETEWADRPDQSSACPQEYREKYAVIDAEDVSRSELVISFTELPGLPGDGSRGGRHVEFGIAYALGKRLFVVGYRENLFHHLPRVEFFATWEEASEALRIGSS
jgi:hypothetical protein